MLIDDEEEDEHEDEDETDIDVDLDDDVLFSRLCEVGFIGVVTEEDLDSFPSLSEKSNTLCR